MATATREPPASHTCPSARALLALADGNPVALGEIGSPFPSDVLTNQPKWVYFMGWAGIFENSGGDCRPNRETPEQCETRKTRFKALFADPRVLGRGDPLPE